MTKRDHTRTKESSHKTQVKTFVTTLYILVYSPVELCHQHIYMEQHRQSSSFHNVLNFNIIQQHHNYFITIIFFKLFFGGIFLFHILHCFICRPSDSTVLTDAGIEPRTVAPGAVRRSNH